MAKNSGGAECALTSWGIAALVAFVALVMLMLLGDWTFLQAAFVGAILFVAGGAFMTWAFCRPLPAAPGVPAQGTRTTRAEPATAPHDDAAAPAPRAAPEPTPQPESAPAQVAVAAPSPAPAAVVEPVTEQAVEPETAPEPVVQPVPIPADKPQMLAAPQGAADDLKLIKGVGPKLEEKLNSMGIWHFAQIAGWTSEQVAWVDDSLNFRGRIGRDDWIGQARVLAAGGTTEFAQRNGRK